MAYRVIRIEAAHDPEADVWFVESSNLPGLNAEAGTVDELARLLPGLIMDLVEEVEKDGGDGDGMIERDVPIELITHTSTKLRLRAEA